MEERSSLVVGLRSLLKTRGLELPDGRPLYAYRFARAEYERVGELLRIRGPSVARDRIGAALVVAHVAEWFRRERDGGHWDWIRPLRDVGISYGPYGSIQYSDVAELVRMGLQVWQRPQPVGGERLLALVRESGFPVAAVRADRKIASWLKHAVLCAERGFQVSEAVGAEAWRVSDRLAQALLLPAVDLCAAIVALRTSIPLDSRQSDPVGFLDLHHSKWRDELPFDVECADVKSMVEEIVRLRDTSGSALDLDRRLIRGGDGNWSARALLAMSGSMDLRRLPDSIAAAVREGRRVRLFPRPPFGDDLVSIGAIEAYEHEQETTYEVRPFVATFEAKLPLEQEARLLVQAGHSTIGEFIPSGGSALDDQVIALTIENVDELMVPMTLRVLGSSPRQTNATKLALAVKSESLQSIRFSEGYDDLGACVEGDRRILSFSGSAVIDVDGVRWRWQTATDSDAEARLVLIGDLVRNVRESVYVGLPRVWIEKEGHVVAPKRGSLRWRPRGRGEWRLFEGGAPWGHVDVAVVEDGEVRYSIGAAIVPPDFVVTFDRSRREIRVAGLATGKLAATGARNLPIRMAGDVAVVDLGPPEGVPIIIVRARWESELSLTLSDPSFELRLIDHHDRLIGDRPSFALDSLRGYRILATREVSLCMELRAADAPRLVITRPVSGEVPLSAIGDTIRQLLGRSESLDARVILSALGANEHIAEVRWYADDVNPFIATRPNAFAALAVTHGLDLRAVSLQNPMNGVVSVVAPAAQASMRLELDRTLPGGPWLLFGRRKQGPTIRPRIVPASPRRLDPMSALSSAIVIDDSGRRCAALATVYADPQKVCHEDIRTLIDLLLVARREALPLSGIDALKGLDHAPAMAAHLLAACETLEERAALLDLQRDLPFLWPSVTVGSLHAGFGVRLEALRTKLADIGIDLTVANRSITSSLIEIVGLRPELAGHATAVFLLLIAADPASGTATWASNASLLRTREADVPTEIRKLISRHEDDDRPPRNLLSPSTLTHNDGLWRSYDTQFSDVIVSPFAVADHAAGLRTLDRSELLRCRDASLYDPEYFETIVPTRINEILRGLAQSGIGMP